jgi:hypothetical protein
MGHQASIFLTTSRAKADPVCRGDYRTSTRPRSRPPGSAFTGPWENRRPPERGETEAILTALSLLRLLSQIANQFSYFRPEFFRRLGRHTSVCVALFAALCVEAGIRSCWNLHSRMKSTNRGAVQISGM